MKLGIVVVYLVNEEDDRLLELHLEKIQKHTTVPYVIYAGANRLLPKFRSRLEQHSEVRICPLVPTDLQGDREHAFYLDQLVQIAIDDGVTHIVTLHTDSFPIRDGWAEDLDARLGGARFATVAYGPYTACLFFRREFYIENQPRFRLTDAERDSATYQQFTRKHPHIRHCGVGYLYRAFERGFNWRAIPESNPGEAFGAVYDGTIFHLQGNARLQITPSGVRELERKAVIAQLLRGVHWLVRNLVPKRARQFLWQRLMFFSEPLDRLELGYMKQQLLDNPEAMLERITTGR